MQFEEEGSRIQDLRLILDRVSFAATLFDADGISLRFMNTDLSGARDPQGRPLQDGVASQQQIEQIMRGVQFKGLTPMGTSLRKKVIDEIVLQKAAAGQLKKPVLVIAITDGQPAGEPQNAVFDTIRYAFDTLQQRYPQYGRGGVAFEFAQVGNDEMAKKFLAKLDEDPQIGPMVDCTSSKSRPHTQLFFPRARANAIHRLRERAGRNEPRQPPRRPDPRPLDHEAPPRRHRPQLRLAGREVEPSPRQLRRSRRPIWRTPSRPVRRAPGPIRRSPSRPGPVRRSSPGPRPVRRSSARPVRPATPAARWIPASGRPRWPRWLPRPAAAAPSTRRARRLPRPTAVRPGTPRLWRCSSSRAIDRDRVDGAAVGGVDDDGVRQQVICFYAVVA
jgi:hypothetical protein